MTEAKSDKVGMCGNNGFRDSSDDIERERNIRTSFQELRHCLWRCPKGGKACLKHRTRLFSLRKGAYLGKLVKERYELDPHT
jgi:hypothetical protein